MKIEEQRNETNNYVSLHDYSPTMVFRSAAPLAELMGRGLKVIFRLALCVLARVHFADRDGAGSPTRNFRTVV